MIEHCKIQMTKDINRIGMTMSFLRLQGEKSTKFLTAQHSSLSFPSEITGIREVHEYYRRIATSLLKAIETSEKHFEKHFEKSMAEIPASSLHEQGE